MHVFATDWEAAENLLLIRQIARVLGLPDQHWPHFARLQEMCSGQKTNSKPKPFEDLLQCRCWVRRTLEAWPRARALIASLVRWDPKERLSAEDGCEGKPAAQSAYRQFYESVDKIRTLR